MHTDIVLAVDNLPVKGRRSEGIATVDAKKVGRLLEDTTERHHGNSCELHSATALVVSWAKPWGPSVHSEIEKRQFFKVNCQINFLYKHSSGFKCT